MLGLRLNEGLSVAGLGFDVAGLQKLKDRNWIELVCENLRLTRAGRHFCSEVVAELI